MRYSNHYQSSQEQVKVAVLADQMRANEDTSLSVTDLLMGCAAVALAMNLFLILH